MIYSAYAAQVWKFNVSGVDSEGEALSKAQRLDPEVTHVVLQSELEESDNVSGR